MLDDEVALVRVPGNDAAGGLDRRAWDFGLAHVEEYVLRRGRDRRAGVQGGDDLGDLRHVFGRLGRHEDAHVSSNDLGPAGALGDVRLIGEHGRVLEDIVDLLAQLHGLGGGLLRLLRRSRGRLLGLDAHDAVLGLVVNLGVVVLLLGLIAVPRPVAPLAAVVACDVRRATRHAGVGTDLVERLRARVLGTVGVVPRIAAGVFQFDPPRAHLGDASLGVAADGMLLAAGAAVDDAFLGLVGVVLEGRLLGAVGAALLALAVAVLAAARVAAAPPMTVAADSVRRGRHHLGRAGTHGDDGLGELLRVALELLELGREGFELLRRLKHLGGLGLDHGDLERW